MNSNFDKTFMKHRINSRSVKKLSTRNSSTRDFPWYFTWKSEKPQTRGRRRLYQTFIYFLLFSNASILSVYIHCFMLLIWWRGFTAFPVSQDHLATPSVIRRSRSNKFNLVDWVKKKHKWWKTQTSCSNRLHVLGSE